MARLSNFIPDGDAPLPDDPRSDQLNCRPVRREEVDDALRLLLAGHHGLAGDEQVLDFLSFTMNRGLDVNSLWVAERRGKIQWTMLPVVSPGRTMLILSPCRLFRHTPADAAIALADAICAEHSQQGVHLAQLLLDPAFIELQDVYANCGFHSLAELIYLRRAIKQPAASFDLSANYELKSYAPELDDLFSRTISASYAGSLDCPGLNGMRDMRDVLTGHKAGAEFLPHLWHVLLEDGEPRAVLLLNRSSHADAMELVYLGLVLAARGCGISDLMMNLATHLTSKDGKNELTLAVDSRNAPALKLYHRHGMQRMASRTAMIRDLRSMIPQPV